VEGVRDRVHLIVVRDLGERGRLVKPRLVPRREHHLHVAVRAVLRDYPRPRELAARRPDRHDRVPAKHATPEVTHRELARGASFLLHSDRHGEPVTLRRLLHDLL